MNKGFAPIAIILIIAGVLVLAGGVYLWQKQIKTGPVACPQEAEQCPDDSYVGRTGPNCEFAACPNLDNCAKEGERVRSSGEGFPANCCSGLKTMYGYAQEDCSAPGIPGDIGTCGNCGNGVCEPQNNENKCNCPQDCSSNSTPNWQTYRNEEYGFEIQYPKIWIKKDPIPKFDTFIIKIASNERFGNPPSLVYTIWIAKHGTLPMLDGIKMDYTEEKIGDLTTYKTTKIPAADGILSYFFKKSNGEYIEISMSPYGTKFPEQTKYVGIFDQILSTFKFIK